MDLRQLHLPLAIFDDFVLEEAATSIVCLVDGVLISMWCERTLTILLSAPLWMGCASESATTGAWCGAIVQGTLDTTHSGVVHVYKTEPHPAGGTWQSTCTGTLIAPTTVLTAAHCIDNGVSAIDVQVDGESYPAEKWLEDPEKVYWEDLEFDIDAGVIYLSTAPPVRPHLVALTAPATGSDAIMVGYGRTGPDADDYGVRHMGRGKVSEANESSVTVGGTHLGMATGCNGDSGGPVFVEHAGEEVHYGIMSGSDCIKETVAVSTPAFVGWLRKVAPDVRYYGEDEPWPAAVPQDAGAPPQDAGSVFPQDGSIRPEGSRDAGALPAGGNGTIRGACSLADPSQHYAFALLVTALWWSRRRRSAR